MTGFLQIGWRKRLIDAFSEGALRLRTLGRSDLLATKVFALCDRGTDLNDGLAFAPTSDELKTTQSWLEQQDLNPEWPAHTRTVISNLS